MTFFNKKDSKEVQVQEYKLGNQLLPVVTALSPADILYSSEDSVMWLRRAIWRSQFDTNSSWNKCTDILEGFSLKHIVEI